MKDVIQTTKSDNRIFCFFCLSAVFVVSSLLLFGVAFWWSFVSYMIS